MTLEVASKYGSQFRYVTEGNTGLCYARNRGVLESTFDFVCLLDDDVTFDPGFVSASLAAVSESGADVIVPRIVSPVVDDWPEWLKTRVSSGVGQYEAGPARIELRRNGKLPVGAAVIYRKDLHEEFGLFATNLDRIGKKLFGGGETAFFKKVRQGGARMIYEPRIRVDHHLTQEKWTKSYWRRQGFYGGRSFVRMESLFGTLRASYFIESLAKSFYWGVKAALLPNHRFQSQYHMLAHLGRCFELIALLAAPRKRSQGA
jgi:glycosyltransferase involved in cell wall biosynthesis